MLHAAEWNQAHVAEPAGFVDEDLNTVGVFTLKAGTPTILSLSPGEDFELNTSIIHHWKLLFQASDDGILGDANYDQALKELTPYVIDQQNGSILIKALSDVELDEILAQAMFA